jgi:hypothetical protein
MLEPLDRSVCRGSVRLSPSKPSGPWQSDADLAGLRDKDALAKLPIPEQEACRRLWADVAALLQRAGQAQ